MAEAFGPSSRSSGGRPPQGAHARRRAFCGALAAFAVAAIWPTDAEADVPTIGKPRGRPRIKIDRLTFPPDLAGSAMYVRHLERTLKQEARRADWGAGRGSTIAFRFAVEELTLRSRGSALEVRCSARGELPKRRAARSHLVYSGDPSETEELVKRVLTIVARGVVTRLADLERTRRGR